MNEKFEVKTIPNREPDKDVALPNGDIVQFWGGEDHVYTVNGEYRICLSDALIGTEIKSDPKDVVSENYLKEAAEYGTEFHKIIEDFVKEGKEPLVKTPAFRFFKEKIYPLCKEWHSETIVCNEYMVGTCDLWGITEKGTVIVIDIKTGVVYTDACEFQESFYGDGLKYSCYLPSSVQIDYFVFSAKNSTEDCDFLPIKEKTHSELENLRTAVFNRCAYVCPYEKIDVSSFIPTDYKGGQDKFLRDFLNWKINNSLFEKFENEIKEQVQTGEKESSIFDTPLGYFAYKKATTTKNVFDQESFKKNCPKMYARYYRPKTYYSTRFNKKSYTEEDLKPYEIENGKEENKSKS